MCDGCDETMQDRTKRKETCVFFYEEGTKLDGCHHFLGCKYHKEGCPSRPCNSLSTCPSSFSTIHEKKDQLKKKKTTTSPGAFLSSLLPNKENTDSNIPIDVDDLVTWNDGIKQAIELFKTNNFTQYRSEKIEQETKTSKRKRDSNELESSSGKLQKARPARRSFDLRFDDPVKIQAQIDKLEAKLQAIEGDIYSLKTLKEAAVYRQQRKLIHISDSSSASDY